MATAGLVPPFQAFPAAPSLESHLLELEIIILDTDSCILELLLDSKRQKCWVLLTQILIQKVPNSMRLGEQVKPSATMLTLKVQSDGGS